MRCLNRILRGKAFLFLLAMTALLAPASLMGQTELTVYDGQNTNGLVPYSYEYRTEWQKCEFVIPASALADMGATAQVPKLISEMTFYYSWYGYNTELCDFMVFVEEVDFESFEGQTSFHGYDNATVVYNGRLNYSQNKVKVSYDENFVYHGGNLLIGMYTTKKWYYYDGSSYFSGTTVENAAMEGHDEYHSDSITANIINFIPKTTFVYYDEDYCFAPKDLNYDESSISPTSVTLDWTPRGQEQEWKIRYHYYDEEEVTQEVIVDEIFEHPYTLTGLQPGTSYYNIDICAVCGDDDVSDWTNYYYNGFTTPICNPEDQCELHYELRSTDGEWGWGWSSINVSYKRGEDDYVSIQELCLYNGTFQTGDLNLCDGGTYLFSWIVGDEYVLPYISFVITDPYGNPIEGLDYSNGNVPEEETTLLEDFVMQCPSCKKPRDFSVTTTSTSASFTWTADSGYDAWELQYSTDQTNWSTPQTVTETPACSIDNLQPATKYYARVRANCGDDEYSPWAVRSFYTDCATLTVDESYSYTENFEDYEPYNPDGGEERKGSGRMEVSGSYPLCWSSWNEAEDWENAMYPIVYFNEYEMESNCLMYYVYNYDSFEPGELDQYAILPAIENISSLQMSFKVMTGESMEYVPFCIGVMTDPTDPETFDTIHAYGAIYEWETIVTYFNHYTGEGQYIAIKLGTPEEWDFYMLYIDDVEVSVLPSCFIPSKPVPSYIGEDEVTLTWEPNGDETSWEVRYSTDRTHWTVLEYTLESRNESISMELTGLLPNTLYYVQVRAKAGEGEYSEWSQMNMFRTGCGEYQPVPYYEDFESYSYGDEVPQCWEKINESTYEYNDSPYITSDGNGNYLVFYLDRHDYFDYQPQTAILPKMENISNLQLRFDAKDNYQSGYAGHIIVGVIDDDEVFHQIVDLDPENNVFSSHIVTFEDYNGVGNTGKIAFRLGDYFYAPTWYYYVYIDNIFVSQYVNKDIEAYTADDNGWYLIASPVMGSLSPEDVDQLTSENFDLYAFDQSAVGVEWRNYKADTFELENGQGYLYANSNAVTLSFAGAMQSESSVNVPLYYTEGNPNAGWNIVGNPFNGNATLSGATDFYRINGNVLEASSGEISPCEGVFVHATATGQSVTFERAETAKGNPIIKGSLDFGLFEGSMGRRLDLVRIRFDEGDNLEKINLLSDPNELCIPLDGKAFAVVHSGTFGEMPLNFKAAENGLYTINVNIDKVKMSYLHLVDQFTGTDVDLLTTPVYSFDAQTTDKVSRFKIIFTQVQ